ncbi:ImcF-related family protein [Citrobacter werkmanii]|uniref:ImcF-related family protein n=1 Tax=Citrobacter werkmanii TaxID=67827 RepID=UPI002655087D|nr:ImcF-related family protein [Citrobacter werkmanii]MDN8559112.1 ImcF-related family protein [Citrobacter werkmanii]
MFKEKKATEISVAATAILWVAIVTLFVLAGGLGWWFWKENHVMLWSAIREIIAACFIIWAGTLSILMLGFIAFRLLIRDKVISQQPLARSNTVKKVQHISLFQPLKSHLRRRYGPFWRYKIRLLLVVGDTEQVTAIAPGLANKQWLEGTGTVLIHGGSLNTAVAKEWFDALRKLRRHRPLDGVVLALSEAQAIPVTLGNAVRTLELAGEALHWQPPVYLWQIRDSAWSQEARITQAVGALFPLRATPDMAGEQLTAILPPLYARGVSQLNNNPAHDWSLRLARWLEQEGTARWQSLLTPWLSEHQKRLPLRGLMFSPSLPENDAASVVHEHRWTVPAVWQGVTVDCGKARGERVGMAWEHTAKISLLTLLALWGFGSVVAFAVNRQQINGTAERVQQLVSHPEVNDAQLMQLQALRNDTGRLQAQQKNGAPWYQRFGLDHSAALLTAMMPEYGQANNRLIRDAAVQVLRQKLTTLANLPPRSPLRETLAKPGYDQLRAYLMMAHPEKADAAFFTQVMKTASPSRPGLSTALWQDIAPDLWVFWMQNLPAEPAWKITPDAALVAQARQVLLEQIGQRNAESTLYENMLTAVRRNYADMTLEDMTPQTDARRLFSTQEVVPGMFTRQAWEGGIQEAIDNAVASRRDEIDWVLSDNRKAVIEDVSPEALKQRLTDRYFTDFAGAWLSFLNSIRLNPADNIADVTDQLTLVGDVRQSPLIALMNTLAWQGQTGQQGEAIADSLVKSAKKLIGKSELPVIDQQAAGPAGPLDSTFGPLLALMGKNSAQNVMAADSSLSLQTYLTRLTRVRLRLQQVANAPDPQAMMQQLAQTVFQGKSVDLTDTQAYGSLVAASLGEEWSGFGDTMFVQPLTQAWETVLQPSAASLNEAWQRSIAVNWHSAFDGRYPFAAGRNDVSLPMLAEFVRHDTGRIDRFLSTQLGGVLHKEGSNWVADETHSQGLTFSPAFLSAVNQLSQLSDILFTDGGLGISFEMQGVAMPEIVETQLTFDGQTLRYFNQLADWQSIRWPGVINKPGAMLTWTSTSAGARLLANYSGPWGTLRMLEQAKREKVSDGLYRLTLTAPDNRQLQWLLRTEMGDGPLALLKLRNFTLPSQIFSVDAVAPVQDTATNSDDLDNSDGGTE